MAEVAQDIQARKGWMILSGAIAANIILCGILVWLFNLTFDQPSELEVTPTDEFTATHAPTATVFWQETMTPTATLLPAATDTPPLPTPLPTLTPVPTRREIFEPTKPPYIFPTPIHIPPVPRASPTLPRSR